MNDTDMISIIEFIKAHNFSEIEKKYTRKELEEILIFSIVNKDKFILDEEVVNFNIFIKLLRFSQLLNETNQAYYKSLTEIINNTAIVCNID